MTQDEVLRLFKEKDALLTGHFKLSSGMHSERYLQCALILQYPVLAERIAKALAEMFSKEKIDVVVGPAMGGITLAYEIARHLGVRGIFTERQEGPSTSLGAGEMLLRRGFYIKKGERVLVVEDVVTTGLSTKEVIGVIEAAGATVVGVASIIDRSAGKADFGIPFKSLAGIEIKTYSEKDCPLCKKGMPIVKPGTRK
jgi:orotate phosphoribosyltransferase